MLTSPPICSLWCKSIITLKKNIKKGSGWKSKLEEHERKSVPAQNSQGNFKMTTGKYIMYPHRGINISKIGNMSNIKFSLCYWYNKELNSTPACFYYLGILGYVKSWWWYTSHPEPSQQFPEGTTTNLHGNQPPNQSQQINVRSIPSSTRQTD